MPGSDIDSALAWDADEGDMEAKSYMLSLGSLVCGALAGCGLAADERGATAGQDLFVRPVSAWRRLIRETIKEPREQQVASSRSRCSWTVVSFISEETRLISIRGSRRPLAGEDYFA